MIESAAERPEAGLALEAAGRSAPRWRDLLLLFALGALVNTLVALLTPGPGYVDDTYYFHGGAMIASGQMRFPYLLEPYFWNYAAAPGALPAPGFGYWQPLPSLLTALGIRLLPFLPDFRAAQAVFVLLAGLLPTVAYLLTLWLDDDGRRAPRRAMLAGLLTVFSGIYVRYWSLPESFTPFALSAAGALLLTSEAWRRGRPWLWLLAGVCAGLAHLTRADGLLVIGVIGLLALLPPPRSAGERARRSATARLLAAGFAAGGYLLVMGPWFARNVAAFGSPQAPGGLRTLWLVEYNDLFNYPSDLTPGRYFSAGWGAILGAKGRALLLNLATFVSVHNLVFLTPFTLIGWLRRWRRPALLPATLYGLALFAAMTFAFTLPGMRGGWLHSGAALVPFVMAAGALGLDDAVRWAAARRAGWRAESAWRVFSAASVVMAALVVVVMVAMRVGGEGPAPVYRQAGEAMARDGAGTSARVMSNNPPAFHCATGYGGIPLVNGGEGDLLHAADDYGVTYLVIDENVPDGLVDLYLHGPISPRFELVSTLGSAPSVTALYRILPPR